MIAPQMLYAANWPERPIQMVVQFPAGTTTDAVARDLASRLSDKLNQSVVVVNKPGAGGVIGVNTIATSKPDGYTIGTVNFPTLAIIPHLQGTPYDPLTAFTHLAVVGPYDYGIFVKADAPWKTLNELVEYVRQHPDQLSYGTLAPGTTNQLLMERLSNDLKLGWNYIPYKGDTESVVELMAGRIIATNASPTTMLPQVTAGKVRMLASTGPKRWAALPDVPTLAETGLGSYSQNSFLSLAAPAGLDKTVQAQLSNALEEILTDNAVRKEYEQKFGQAVVYQSGEQYAKVVKDEYALWGRTLGNAAGK